MNNKDVGTIKTTFNIATENMDGKLADFTANMTLNNPEGEFSFNNPNSLNQASDITNKSFKVRRKINDLYVFDKPLGSGKLFYFIN